MRSILMLANGTVWEGQSLGAPGEIHGEVVFNTSMTGYEDVIVDPSGHGEILTLTYPLIGNYGINSELVNLRPYIRGLVVGVASLTPNHWQAGEKLTCFMKKHGLVGISGVDTRALTRVLRNEGTMKGAIASGEINPGQLLARINEAPDISDQDLVSAVTVSKPHEVSSGEGKRIVVLDFGAKRHILAHLKARGCRVTMVPASTSAENVLALYPDGVFLTSGPGDPAALPGAVKTVSRLVGKVPLFGIGLGHQIMALALGAKTYRLKHGHRGSNHPVMDIKRNRVLITSQNHGFSVDAESLPNELLVTHTSLHDGTVEGLQHRYLNFSSVQYDPLTSPDSLPEHCLVDRFLSELQRSA